MRKINFLVGLTTTHYYRAVVHYHGGDIPRMLEESRAAWALIGQVGDSLYEHHIQCLLGWAESRSGNHDAARDALAQAEAGIQRLGGHALMGDWFTAVRAEVALNAGRPEEALALAEESVAVACPIGSLFAQGVASASGGKLCIG